MWTDYGSHLRSAGGTPPPVDGLLDQVQIDHTVIDVTVVDERHRLPIGRPYVTVAIDVFSRAIVGLVVALEAPSALSVGLCLTHMVADKRAWLERIGVDIAWPMSGKPAELYLDNAAEFKSEALRGVVNSMGRTASPPQRRRPGARSPRLTLRCIPGLDRTIDPSGDRISASWTAAPSEGSVGQPFESRPVCLMVDPDPQIHLRPQL